MPALRGEGGQECGGRAQPAGMWREAGAGEVPRAGGDKGREVRWAPTLQAGVLGKSSVSSGLQAASPGKESFCFLSPSNKGAV